MCHTALLDNNNKLHVQNPVTNIYQNLSSLRRSENNLVRETTNQNTMQMVPYKYMCNSDPGFCSSHYAWAASQCWVPAKRLTSPEKECCCTTPMTTGLPGNSWNTILTSTTTSQGVYINIMRNVIYMQLMWVVVVITMRKVSTSAHMVQEWVRQF